MLRQTATAVAAANQERRRIFTLKPASFLRGLPRGRTRARATYKRLFAFLSLLSFFSLRSSCKNFLVYVLERSTQTPFLMISSFSGAQKWLRTLLVGFLGTQWRPFQTAGVTSFFFQKKFFFIKDEMERLVVSTIQCKLLKAINLNHIFF